MSSTQLYHSRTCSGCGAVYKEWCRPGCPSWADIIGQALRGQLQPPDSFVDTFLIDESGFLDALSKEIASYPERYTGVDVIELSARMTSVFRVIAGCKAMFKKRSNLS